MVVSRCILDVYVCNPAVFGILLGVQRLTTKTAVSTYLSVYVIYIGYGLKEQLTAPGSAAKSPRWKYLDIYINIYNRLNEPACRG